MSGNITGSKDRWIKLAPFPRDDWNGTQLMKINETEFARCSAYDYVYKYSIDTNTWKAWIKYPSDLREPAEIVSAFDQNAHILYIFTSKCLYKIDTLSKELISCNTISKDTGRCARGVIVNHKFHVIGGLTSKCHFIWNDDKQDFDEIYKFEKAYGCMSQSGLIHIESTNTLLAFGGHDEDNEDMDIIYSYDLNQQKWKTLCHTLPDELSCFGTILTEDEKYIIILAGMSGGVEEYDTDDIYIWNTNSMNIVESGLVCPQGGCGKAIRMGNRTKMEALTFGYVRNMWLLPAFSAVMYPPDELIKLINLFCATEDVYFLDHNGKHWRIRLDEIFKDAHVEVKNLLP